MAAPAAGTELDRAIDDYLAVYWQSHPVLASRAGVHGYDDRLRDLSAAAFQQELQQQRAFLERLGKLDTAALAPETRVDLRMARAHAQRLVFELADVEWWRRRPRRYVELLRDSVAVLTERDFAPAERRFQAAVVRMKLLPRALEQARANLAESPAADTKVAIAEAQAAAEWLEKNVPDSAGLQGAKKKLQQQVAREGGRAGSAMRQFAAWMEKDLLPRAGTPAPLGAERYGRLLRDINGVSASPDDIAAAAEREIRQLRAAAVMLPSPPAFRDIVSEARRVVRDKRIAPLPQPDRLRLAQSPSSRPVSTAVLDPPGPFQADLPFLLYVPREQPAASAAVREGYPGRYVQTEFAYRSQRLARKVFASPAFTEGWALYAQELMAENAFALDAAAAVRQAAAEALVDVRLHTGRSTPAEAAAWLRGTLSLDAAAAEALADSILLNPGVAAVFAGRTELKSLREQVQRRRGPAFSLLEFHESLLELGAPPPSLAAGLLLQAR